MIVQLCLKIHNNLYTDLNYCFFIINLRSGNRRTLNIECITSFIQYVAFYILTNDPICIRLNIGHSRFNRSRLNLRFTNKRVFYLLYTHVRKLFDYTFNNPCKNLTISQKFLYCSIKFRISFDSTNRIY